LIVNKVQPRPAVFRAVNLEIVGSLTSSLPAMARCGPPARSALDTRAVAPVEPSVPRDRCTFPAQLLHARADHREIVGSAGAGHRSSLLVCCEARSLTGA
jgi:hypothetical protein